MKTMAERQVRRLPVGDGDDLVGILSQADLVKALPEGRAVSRSRPSPTPDVREAVTGVGEIPDAAGSGTSETQQVAPMFRREPGESHPFAADGSPPRRLVGWHRRVPG